jgi:DNA (cytosine-5)-methyltransferase 1
VVVVKLRVLDLFSGIGGFSLGLERATLPGATYDGFETVAFCEIEEFPRRVLAKHWPDVPCYDDVRSLTGERLAADGIAVDVICGGFPCQGVSIAGRGAGLEDKRSALWWEFRRLVEECTPRFVVIENSPKLRGRGLHAILIALDALGYDAEWHCIPASHAGAPHRRDRIWIIAYRQEYSLGSNADMLGSHTPSLHLYRSAELRDEQERDFGPLAWWRSEPSVDRVANGLPGGLVIDLTRAIGNAVVPMIPEMIGRAILASVDAQRIAA